MASQTFAKVSTFIILILVSAVARGRRQGRDRACAVLPHCSAAVYNGYFVLRFLADDVGKNLDRVLDAIQRALFSRRKV